MPPGNIRYRPTGNPAAAGPLAVVPTGLEMAGTQVVSFLSSKRNHNMMMVLSNPLFWRMKVRIAILAAATFVAMC